MPQTSPNALIIGGSRGLGLGLVRAYLAQGWRVVTTRRAPAPELDALAASSGGRLTVEILDVTNEAGIKALHGRLASDTFDLLFVSAGVSNSKGETIGEVSTGTFMADMITNALSPLRLIETFTAQVAPGGAIVAMSSVLGSVGSNTTGGYEVYRASKAALNTLLRSFSVRNKARSVVALHPGWVRTDMGGASAAIDIETSVNGMIEVVASRMGKPGCVYLDYQGKPVSW